MCDSGRLREAAALYERLVGNHARQQLVLNRLAGVLLELRDFDASRRWLRQSLRLNPNQRVAHLRLGLVLYQMGKYPQALASYDRALALDPKLVEAHYHRGIVLNKLKRLPDALASYDRAIAAAPDNADAHCNRAMLLRKLGRLPEALAAYDQAIALRTDHAKAHLNRGVLLGECKRVAEGLASFDRAIALRPEYADARMLKAELLLLAGEYSEGWSLYEWRWRSRFRELDPALSRIPCWDDGQPLANKTVLVHSEVGFGDLIMFSRYASLLRERGATPVIVAPEPLLALLGGLDGDPRIVSPEGPLPHADYRCPIMSLPWAFKTTAETVPAGIPYLRTDSAKQEQWRERLGPRLRPRVGLAWAGNAGRGIDEIAHRNRSVPLRALHPFWDIAVDFHSLQKDVPAGDERILPEIGRIEDHSGQLLDFSDTAALVQQMDLVISIDTAVAHLAGALGKPLWVMLPYASDYRWTLDGKTTPWYADATLFRQSAPAGWDEVVEKVRRALAALAEKSRAH